MTEANDSAGSNKPLDAAMDLLVFAPFGLALTAAEEIPKLAAKGRATLTGQLAMAKMLGQFAVAQGRKEIEKRWGGSRPAPGGRPAGGAERDASAGPPSAGSPSAGPQVPTTAYHDAGQKTYESLLATNGRGDAEGSGAAEEEASSAEPAGGPAVGSTVGSVPPPADGLAIPGYDSLSASQVVQRLGGLSQEELAAVGAYEEAHRGRRTVLARVRQLQGG